jgi:hypothetical protein
MQVKVKQANAHHWYKDSIGDVFDVIKEIHPTFGFERYLLQNTESNKDYMSRFKDKGLYLMCLRDGYLGIYSYNAEEVN